MGKNKNTIEINGQIYNATTGALLGHGLKTTKKAASKNVDGVLAGAVISPTPKAIRHPAKRQTATPPVKKIKVSRVASRPKTSVGHAVQHSSTLMRHAVKKPTTQDKHRIKVHGQTNSSVNHAAVPVKLSARRLDERRLSHAKKVNRSQHVSRFGKGAHLATPAPKPVHHKHAGTTRPPQHHSLQPSIRRHKTTADILQDALDHASSHKQTPPKRQRTRKQHLTSFSVLTVSAAVLLGFVAFQSLPTIKVRLASAQAGVAASLPGYNPSGFHMGGLDYGAGVVAMNYMSNSDENRKFAITQKTSSWDSTTLRDIFVEGKDKNFQTIEEGGRTLFLYGQNNATWVDNGVWYQVQSAGALSNRQLVDIAKSL